MRSTSAGLAASTKVCISSWKENPGAAPATFAVGAHRERHPCRANDTVSARITHIASPARAHLRRLEALRR